MAYLPSQLGGLSPEVEEALFDVSTDDVRALETVDRIEYAIRSQELETRKREAFWTALQSFATAAIPIATFFGITKIFGGR